MLRARRHGGQCPDGLTASMCLQTGSTDSGAVLMEVVYVQGMAVIPEALAVSCFPVQDDIHALKLARGDVEESPDCFVPGCCTFAMEAQPSRPEYAVNTCYPVGVSNTLQKMVQVFPCQWAGTDQEAGLDRIAATQADRSSQRFHLRRPRFPVGSLGASSQA